jgi:endonuclease/exonuclease/phosphatase family metal-dependent hydrolase
MRIRVALTGLGSAAALLACLVAPSVTAPAAATGHVAPGDVVVGSFNLSSVSFDPKASGEHRKWRERRPTVVAQILQQKLDVIGLQEANQSSKYAAWLDYGVNQYTDLKGALRAAGGSYALTNENAYNCARPHSSYNCAATYRGASQDNRIMYNTKRVTLVRQGAVRFPTQTPGKNERYLAWAVFAMKDTGKQFFFTTTHLDPYSIATRKAQWSESIRNTDRLKGNLPVIATGDYNTSKWDTWARTYLPAMKNRGYGDVLNQQYQNPLAKPRAESVRQGWINSYNGYTRNMRTWAYEDARHKVGNNIDYIFASNRLRVKQYSNVTPYDARTWSVRGVIASDHALIRATLVL